MITVIVPTYNEEKNIEGCLRAIAHQTIPRDTYEIIVVDGASKDKTVEIASKYADKVMQQVSQGVGGARNDGAAVAKGEIIATTDADCLPDEDWLENIQRNFRDSGLVAVTGYLDPMIPEETSGVDAIIYRLSFKIANWLCAAGSWVGYYHLCGANTAFRRDAFMEIKGYSPLAYADDLEIAKRLREKGSMRTDSRVKIDYSVRRIQKLGIARYTWNSMKNDFNVMLLGKNPVKGSYARQNYD